jgi:ribosome biogenesis GTPase
VSRLERLGWNTFFQEQLRPESASLRVARVIEEQRGLCRVAGEVDGWAEVSGRFRHDAHSAADFPAVGDWVAVAAPTGANRGIIHRRFERRSTVSRKAAGRGVDEQVLAANVDTILLVTAFAADLNPRRIERYLTMVWEAGASPVVVLNKSDLAADSQAAVAAVRHRLALRDVVAVSALTAEGLDGLRSYLTPGATIALLGSSGVGKSTIVNRLLGNGRQSVSAVRQGDGKGRHTTTSRQLVELASGALLIDTPGMRELVPWIDEAAVDGAFSDIAELAQRCQFGDCAHDEEPGCAILAAVAAGELPIARLEHYRGLLREAAHEERKRDASRAAEEKRRWKQLHQAQKAFYRERNRA